MSDKFNLLRPKIIKRTAALTIFIFVGIAQSAFAIFIDFDDLNPVYDEVSPCWCDNPLTDQYLSKGLLINGAWVNGENGHNSMLTSNLASFDFVGELPTFFSININSVHDDAVLLSIYGEDGLILETHTAGWTGPDDEYIPVIPNEFFSFSSAQGIKHIDIQGYYWLRTGAEIDNLTYTYSSVPEPSSLALIGAGLVGLFIRRTRLRKNYFPNDEYGQKI